MLSWGHRLLLLFFLVRAHAPVQVGVPALPAVSLLLVAVVVTVGTQSGLSGRHGGVMIVGDGDLLILLSLQLALVEAQRPLQDVFDLAGSKSNQGL